MNHIFWQRFAPPFLKNVLFYQMITGFIFLIHTLHIRIHFSHEPITFFKLVLCALAESCLEGLGLCFIGSFFSKQKLLERLFVVIAAFIPVMHLIDFILERLFNLSVWHTCLNFFSESLPNMLELLYATNFPLWRWAFGFIVLISLGGVFLMSYQKILALPQTVLSRKSLKVALILVGCLYFPVKYTLCEVSSLPFHETRVLPFKSMFPFEEKVKGLKSLAHNSLSDGAVFKATLGSHLFIFIIESLRQDAINPVVAPCMDALGREHFRHPFCIASANGTHLSWYSIFFSQPAFLWKSEQLKGSPLIKDLKKEGYKICVLSSPRLSYYGMDQLMFGSRCELVDHYFCPKMTQELTAFEADRACFMKLEQIVESLDSKGAFIVFLDATHFGYSLPSQNRHPFEPFVSAIPYVQTVFSKVDVQGIKNRYFNAIHAVDRLFGQFFDFLKHKGLFDESLVMLTSDHGEEFFEQGQLFHASHLSNEQIKIPFILKPPRTYTGVLGQTQTLSHEMMAPFLKAVLANKSCEDSPWQFSCRYNFSQSPKQIVVISQTDKKLYHHQQDHLELIRVFDQQDRIVQQPSSFMCELK
jgi:hypothetical protein